MKTRLLKKIRKRFDWYLREQDKCPIVVDLKTKGVIIFNDKYLQRIRGERPLSEVEIPLDDYRWRMAKDHIYEKFGYSINTALFNKAKKLGVNYKNRRR